jgi:hypothetical protein
LWRIPTRDITTCFLAGFDLKGDFAHAGRLTFIDKTVNSASIRSVWRIKSKRP